MLNKAIIMGRLTKDPELRHTQSNLAVCSFSVAVDRDFKNQNGEKQADFIDCVAWRERAEFVSKWFTKGMLIIVVGRLQTRNWTDKNGNNRISLEIQCDEVMFGETKKSRMENGYSTAPREVAPAAPAPPVQPAYDLPEGNPDFKDLNDDEDDLPF